MTQRVPPSSQVLHLAFKRDDGELVGCMSSTFQPPWCEQGCGHWGLLAVHPDHQSQGVASALVRAGEKRLATVCHEIQMEYHYTYGDHDSATLCHWYEGRLGFVCANGNQPFDGVNVPSGPEGSGEFRMCRKRIPEAAQRAGERRRLEEVRAFFQEQLEAAEAAEAAHAANAAAALAEEEPEDEPNAKRLQAAEEAACAEEAAAR